MRTRFFTVASLILLAAVTLTPAASRAQEGTVPVTTVITVLGPKFSPPLQYFERRHRGDGRQAEGRCRQPGSRAGR